MMGALTIRSSTAWASGESEAVWKQSLYKRRPYVICGARLRTDILDNRSLAMLLEISKGLIYQTLVSGQPLTHRPREVHAVLVLGGGGEVEPECQSVRQGVMDIEQRLTPAQLY